MFGQTKDDGFDVSHGLSLKLIDSADRATLRFIQFDSSNGVIFPANYTYFNLGKGDVFTPDTILIRVVEREVLKQYCQAEKRFVDLRWQESKARYLKDKDSEYKEAKKQYKKGNLISKKFCPKWQRDLKYYDKQFAGFITSSGEKMILAQLCNFRQDPYSLKKYFGESWINGWHGWFETNTRQFNYHIAKKLLTVNEDF